VGVQHDITGLIKTWKGSYRERYGGEPAALSDLDSDILRRAVTKVGSPKLVEKLLSHFFTLDGYKNYYVQKGHTIGVFGSSIEEILASLYGGSKSDAQKETYVVGYTKSGKPVCSHKPVSLFKGFSVVPWNEWLSQTHDERLQGLPWRDAEIQVWRDNWRIWNDTWHRI